jgi:uncharacterized membrane protein
MSLACVVAHSSTSMSQTIVVTVLVSAVFIYTVLSGLVLSEQEPTKTVAQANFAVAAFSFIIVVVLGIVIWTAESKRTAAMSARSRGFPS